MGYSTSIWIADSTFPKISLILISPLMSTKTTKVSAQKAISKPAKARGSMKPAEIKPLVIAARKAFDRHSQAGLLDDGETFDSWRHQQCMEAVGKPGITACNHGDFQPLLAHFQTLAGDDAAAFRSLMKTGKPTDHAAPGDTFEIRRQIVHSISVHLLSHIRLAETSQAQLLAEAIGYHHQSQGDLPWEGSSSAQAFRVLMARKDAVAAKGKGPINVGYLVWLTRQKTRRPDLQLGKDWQAGLADRCTASQLDQILFTIINRIAAVEGTGDRKSRNKSQRRTKAITEPF
jgi:hypothetical protein